MNDDRTNIIVSQQRRDLVFGDWTSATIFVPRRVWIGEELLHHLLRCYFRAVLGERRPQSRQQLYSDAWLIWSARDTADEGVDHNSVLRKQKRTASVRTMSKYEKWLARPLAVLPASDLLSFVYKKCEQIRNGSDDSRSRKKP